MDEKQSLVLAEELQCWICLDFSDPQSDLVWLHPCRCKGAMKWVHEGCLQRWIDEKALETGRLEPFSCRICGTQYRLFHPTGPFYAMLEQLDQSSRSFFEFLGVGILLSTIYWSSITYGAMTVLQVCGLEQGLVALRSQDPLVLVFALPSIPITLLIARGINWTRPLRAPCRWMLRYTTSLGRLWRRDQPTTFPRINDGEFVPQTVRTICLALLLPTIATLTGRLFYRNVRLHSNKVLLGGLTYLGIKGIIMTYYEELQVIRIRCRQIANWDDADDATCSNTTAVATITNGSAFTY